MISMNVEVVLKFSPNCCNRLVILHGSVVGEQTMFYRPQHYGFTETRTENVREKMRRAHVRNNTCQTYVYLAGAE